ncbi:F-box only protein 28 [Scaptodrosophila lebanonensis]|uniref:F-box only protein 28 n=1 Tax=Drosophila lebanonensis TaxID=7225 RepID=A0A6J2T1J4_DROLE|nr:F-box only protein 28 [Scaptodrosophila lebanonensis]
MVSTRQMCGSAGAAGSNDAVAAASSSSAGGSSNAIAAPSQSQEELAMPTRTSVVRRTTHYNQQQQQSLLSNTPVSLAFSASVVTRHHLYNREQANCNQAAPAESTFRLMDLPPEIIIKIFSNLEYKKISNMRLVSHRVNDICMNILNSSFSRLINTTYNRFHAIKANMPRRESARRNHPLACECDIIETCYMRLSLLQMSMGKHIERGHCCFFPGAILDEVHSILNYISITPRLQRPYRVTDELFDLSTMAMEYFKDRIEPTLPGLAYFNKGFYQLPTTKIRPTLAISSDLADSAKNSPPQNHMVLRKGIRKIKQGMKIYNNQLSVLRTELRTCKRKAAEQSKQLAEQQNLLAEQQKQTLEYANRLDENDKKNEEIARKFSTLLQELNKCKTELQYWRSKSPAIPSVCTSCNQKVAPVLPPEDFQALINQGIDPEHIIINDDTDAESDVSASELPLALEKEFVFPDESTTAKLLAVNTATKNLKRKIQTDTETVATSNAMTPSTSKAAAAAAASASTSTAVNVTQPTDSGYSTKLFYGNHQRGGVIVSPVSMLKATNNVLPTQALGYGVESVACNEQIGGGGGQNAEHDDSKKARRVQKANRCVNTHGKRSK